MGGNGIVTQPAWIEQGPDPSPVVNLSGSLNAAQEVNRKDDEGDHQDDMYQAAGNPENKPASPEQQENDGNNEEHEVESIFGLLAVADGWDDRAHAGHALLLPVARKFVGPSRLGRTLAGGGVLSRLYQPCRAAVYR